MNCRTILLLALISTSALFAGCKSGGTATVKASSNAWFAAATSGTPTALDEALKSGNDINAKESRNDYSPLHVAGMAGNVDAVKFIIAKGGNVDALDEDGRTPLMLSLWQSKDAAGVALVEANANLELKDREGKTALMFAAQYGQIDAIKAMVKRSVNLDAQSKNGSTALIFAADKGELEAARTLKAAGASTTLLNSRGRSALDFAIQKKHPEIVKLLQEK